MRHDKNIPELFTDMIEHLSTLFRKEVQLAKTETREKVQQATNAVIYMVIGGVVVLAALVVLLFAAAAFLVEWGYSEEWSLLLVGGVVALLGIIALWKGMTDIKASNLTPQRSVDQMRANVHAAREQV